MSDGLTEKQARFVEEYIIDGNATKAAERAGYSKKTAYSAGQRLLKHVEIQTALQQRRQKVAEKVDVTLAWLIEEAVGLMCAARDSGSYAAAVSALKEIGILSGERVERSERDLNIVSHEDRIAAVRSKIQNARQSRPTTH